MYGHAGQYAVVPSTEAALFLVELDWEQQKAVVRSLLTELGDTAILATKLDGDVYVKIVSAGYRVTYEQASEERCRAEGIERGYFVFKIEFHPTIPTG